MIEKVDNVDAIILNSGGIDSRVLAKLARDAGYKLHSLFINANKEITDIASKASAKTAELYCVDHFVFDFPVDWTCQKTPQNYGIPFLAMLAHTLGAQYATFKGYDTVFVGARSQGRNQKYLDSLNYCLERAIMTKSVTMLAPLFDTTFNGVQALAKELQVPLEDTYSCNHFPADGTCPVCLQRKKVGL